MAAAYSLALVVASHTAALATLSAGASDPALNVYDASDVLLASFALNADGSAVDPVTGAVSLAVLTQEDAALASGTASYAEVADGDGTAHLRMDCVEGVSAINGACVLSSLAIVQGAPAEIISSGLAAPALIGA